MNALVGAFSVIVKTMEHYTALLVIPLPHDIWLHRCVDQDLQVDMDSGDEDNPKMEVTAA